MSAESKVTEALIFNQNINGIKSPENQAKILVKKHYVISPAIKDILLN